MLGSRQAIYRASLAGVELWLRVNPDAAWIVIRMQGGELKYLAVPDARVNEVVAFFPSAGDSPEKFKTFVSTIEAQFAGQWS